MATSPVIEMERKQRRRSIRNLRRQSMGFMELSCLPVPASPDKGNCNPADNCAASQTIADSDDYGTVWMEDPAEDIRAYTKKKERRRSRLLVPLNISNMLNTAMVSTDIDTPSANENMMNIESDSCDVEECENLRGDMCISNNNNPSARFESIFRSEPEILSKDSANSSHYRLPCNSNDAFVNSMENSLSLEDNSTSIHWFSANRYFEDTKNTSQVNTLNFAMPKFDEPRCACVSESQTGALLINTGDGYKTASDSVNEEVNLIHDNDASATYTGTTLSYCVDHLYDMHFDEQDGNFSTLDHTSTTTNDALDTGNNSEDNVPLLNESMYINTSQLFNQAEFENLNTPIIDVKSNMMNDKGIVGGVSETRNKISPNNIISRCKSWLGNVYKKLESLRSPVEDSSNINISRAANLSHSIHHGNPDPAVDDVSQKLYGPEEPELSYINVGQKSHDSEQSSSLKSSVSEQSSTDVSQKSSGSEQSPTGVGQKSFVSEQSSTDVGQKSSGPQSPIDVSQKSSFPEQSSINVGQKSSVPEPSSTDVSQKSLEPDDCSLFGDNIINDKYEWSCCLQDHESFVDDVQSATQDSAVECASLEFEEEFHLLLDLSSDEEALEISASCLPNMAAHQSKSSSLQAENNTSSYFPWQNVNSASEDGDGMLSALTKWERARWWNRQQKDLEVQIASDVRHLPDVCRDLQGMAPEDETGETGNESVTMTTQADNDCSALTTRVDNDWITVTTQVSSDCLNKENTVEPKTTSSDTFQKPKDVIVNRGEKKPDNECIDINDSNCSEIFSNLQGSLHACLLTTDTSCTDTLIKSQTRKRQSVKMKRSRPAEKRERCQQAGKRLRTAGSNDPAMSSNIKQNEESMLLNCPALKLTTIENSQGLAAPPDSLMSYGSPACLQQTAGGDRVSSNGDASASDFGAAIHTTGGITSDTIGAPQECTKLNLVQISTNVDSEKELSASDVSVISQGSNTIVIFDVSIHNDTNNVLLTDQVITPSPTDMVTKHMVFSPKDKSGSEHPTFDNSCGDRQIIFSNDIVSERPVLCEGEESTATTRTLSTSKCKHHDGSNPNISQVSVVKDVVLNCSSVSSSHSFEINATKDLLQNNDNHNMKTVSKEDPQSEPLTGINKDAAKSTLGTESDLGVENNQIINSLLSMEQQQSSPLEEPINRKVRRKRAKRRLSANMRAVNKVELTFSEELLSPLSEMNTSELSDTIHCSPLEQYKTDMPMNQSMPICVFDASQLSEPIKEREKDDSVETQVIVSNKNMKSARKKSRSRRKSADFVLIYDTSSSKDEDATTNRPIRIRRKTANYTLSMEESDIDEENDCDFEVCVKSRKNGKVKEVVSIEDIYRNKNYKAPVEKTWETIYESPRKGKFIKNEIVGCKKFKRAIDFEILSQGKRRKRQRKAVKRGWNATRVRKALVSDEEMQRRLLDLDNIMSGGC